MSATDSARNSAKKATKHVVKTSPLYNFFIIFIFNPYSGIRSVLRSRNFTNAQFFKLQQLLGSAKDPIQC